MQMLHHWLERAHKLGHPQPASPRTILAACRSNLVVRLYHLSGTNYSQQSSGSFVSFRPKFAPLAFGGFFGVGERPLLPVKLPN